MFKPIRHIAFLALTAPFALFAQPDAELIYMPDTTVTVILEDDPVVASIDALAKLPWIANSTFTTDTCHHNVHDFATGSVPEWPKEKVRERVAQLDAETPFDLTYNDVVDSYINLYVTRKREMSSRMLGLSELYFPISKRHWIDTICRWSLSTSRCRKCLNPSYTAGPALPVFGNSCCPQAVLWHEPYELC